jgi:hypothetical protein
VLIGVCAGAARAKGGDVPSSDVDTNITQSYPARLSLLNWVRSLLISHFPHMPHAHDTQIPPPSVIRHRASGIARATCSGLLDVG